MPVDTRNAIRREYVRVPTKRGVDQPYEIWYFKCSVPGCSNEIKLRNGNLPTATGRCKGCNAVKRPYEALYNYMRLSAKHCRRSLEMTYEEFVEFTKCSKCIYCERQLSWSSKNIKENGLAYNLDRIDNSKGYSVENCVPCCAECNFLRRDCLSHEEFLLLSSGLKAIRELRERKGGTEYQ